MFKNMLDFFQTIKDINNHSYFFQYGDRLALYARIRFTKIFYQILSLMGKKEQLQQNLNECHTLLSRCSYMIQIMIKTVNSGEKADEICKFFKIHGLPV